MNSTTIHVILSVPDPSLLGSFTSLHRISSNRFSMQTSRFSPVLRSLIDFLNVSTAPWLVLQSQIPSQAMIRKSSFGWIFSYIISGTHVIICFSTLIFLLSLYSISPRARDKLRVPRTLPSSTKPPAASMRFFSPSLSGLWSSLSSTALPPLDRTHRLSPELAQKIVS